MNLSAYDDSIITVDKTKTWINVRSKTLSSHQIKYRRYHCLLQRYHPIIGIDDNNYDYYIAMCDSPVKGRTFVHNYHNNNGRVRISLAPIWNNTSLVKVSQDINVEIRLVEEQDDGEIYQIVDI